MDTVSAPTLVSPGVGPAVPLDPGTPQMVPRRNWRVLIAPACAVGLWLTIGIFLTWLLTDFDRVLQNQSRWLPWVIFSLFLGSAVLIGWLYWMAYRRHSKV